MDSFLHDFGQYGPLLIDFFSPKRIVHLHGGDIEDIEDTSYTATLKVREHIILLLLTYQFRTSPHGYVPVSHLCRWIYGDDYYQMNDPGHIMQVYISRIRCKLGNANYIVYSHDKGYRLNYSLCHCSVPKQAILAMLKNLVPN